MMTAFEKSAYRGSLLALLAVFVLVLVQDLSVRGSIAAEAILKRPKALFRICRRSRPAFHDRWTGRSCGRVCCRQRGLPTREPCRRGFGPWQAA